MVLEEDLTKECKQNDPIPQNNNVTLFGMLVHLFYASLTFLQVAYHCALAEEHKTMAG